MPEPERTFKLRTEFITLGQLLKAVDLIGSGGEARSFLAQGEVLVNGEPDNRRGRKLRAGDVVLFASGKRVRLS